MKQQLDFDAIDEFNKTIIDSLDFTRRSEDLFYDAVDLADFRDKDAETIFHYLKKEIRLIPFGDHLKRYIYLKSGLTGDYNEIEIKKYQSIIIESFSENYTPKSFHDTTTKISALTKNWLTQVSVNRSVVFLLGFGLNMSVNDVSEFLKKVLNERDFNFKDPQEIIYWYCYTNGYKYPKMLALQKQYEEKHLSHDGAVDIDNTMKKRSIIGEITDDESLLRYIAGYSNDPHITHSKTVNNRFNELYIKCKSLIADFYNSDEHDLKSKKVWTSDNISEYDVEKVFCCGMPVSRDGNLEKLSSSKLAKYFINKRFARKHISHLLSGIVSVDRFDLITLNFFIFSQDEKYTDDNKNRYIAFVDDTNEILNECMMGELYVANPYECFLLMCILSDCPLATYADVWEMSFEE